MAKLQLQFNCLCMFVPDPFSQVVHVLMPAMNGHEGHGKDHEHVVRMLHHGFKGEKKTGGIPMEGWALTLGPENASANLDLDLNPSLGEERPRLPDLTSITNKRVDRALIGPMPGNRVAARITLRSGQLRRLVSEAGWAIAGRRFRLAHQAVWEMDGVDPVLQWKGLNGKSDGDPKPLDTLHELEPQSNLSYSLRIFHVTRDALPPKGATLDPDVMRTHFRAFYPLVGENDPANDLLPSILDKGIGKINCTGTLAQMAP